MWLVARKAELCGWDVRRLPLSCGSITQQNTDRIALHEKLYGHAVPMSDRQTDGVAVAGRSASKGSLKSQNDWQVLGDTGRSSVPTHNWSVNGRMSRECRRR